VTIRVLVVLLLGSTLAAGSASAQGGAFRPRACGSITVRLGGNDYSYRVKEFLGPAPCRTARSVLRGFIARSTVPHGWFCGRGHSYDRWAASCARTGSRSTLVRAYLIAG